MNHLDAYHLAIEIAKRAGFVLHRVASNSETCYYAHPMRPGLLLRLSTHRSKKAPIGIAPPVARVTFSRKDRYLSEKRVYDMMRWAVGSFFINEPKSSQYDGPRKWRELTKNVSAMEMGND